VCAARLIRASSTYPEVAVRRSMYSVVLGCELQRNDLPGPPDPPARVSPTCDKRTPRLVRAEARAGKSYRQV
jgi:hypothetical protein